MSYRSNNNGQRTCWPDDCEMVLVESSKGYWRKECKHCGSSEEWFND